jgi:replication factor C large subunit
MDWAEKYRPKHLSDLVGNGEAVRQISDWARNWKIGTQPLILYGKPGIGKTSAAWSLANDMKWEAIELNASDQRTKAIIEKVAGGSASTGSLSGYDKKLIILDEADNLQGNADRGGARAIVEVIKQAKQPLLLIANDLYGLDGSIRNICIKVQFKALPAKSLVPRLREICATEEISCSAQSLVEIAQQAEGDIRSAVTMLYASSIGKNSITDEDISISGKDNRKSIFDLVSATLGFRKTESLLEMNISVNETPDTVIQWLECNVNLISDKNKIPKAYCAISRSDIYLGDTYRNQYYTLWRYASAIMLYGVHDALKGNFSGYAKIMPPSRWRQMSGAKRMRNNRQELFTMVGSETHMSAATIRAFYLSPLSILAKNNPALMAESLNMNSEHLDILLHDPALSKSIIKELEDERKRKEKEMKKLEKDAQKQTKKEKPKEKNMSALSEVSDKKDIPDLPEKNKSESETISKDKKSSQSTLFSF